MRVPSEPLASIASSETKGWTLRFETFFSNGAPAAACLPLSPGACVHLQIDHPDSEPTNITFLKGPSGQIEILALNFHDPQAHLILSTELANEILTLQSDSIGDYGLLVLRSFLEKPRRLQVSIHVGFVELWRKGWFGVLALGGAQVATYLASQGLNGIGGIQRALKALRSKSSQIEKEL